MTDEELAARVSLIERFANDFGLDLDHAQVVRWVEATFDMPLAWLRLGVERAFARFDEPRRPRPADIRAAARAVAGAVYVDRGDGSGYHSSEHWPPEAAAVRRIERGTAISGVAPVKTTVKLPELPELPAESGPRDARLTLLGPEILRIIHKGKG